MGTGIGVFLVIVFWGFVDIILGVLWLVTRSKRRDCPACGEKMTKKAPTCANCGFDYRNLQNPAAAAPFPILLPATAADPGLMGRSALGPRSAVRQVGSGQTGWCPHDSCLVWRKPS